MRTVAILANQHEPNSPPATQGRALLRFDCQCAILKPQGRALLRFDCACFLFVNGRRNFAPFGLVGACVSICGRITVWDSVKQTGP